MTHPLKLVRQPRRSSAALRTLWLLASLSALSSCAAPSPIVSLRSGPDKPYTAAEYRAVLKRWTRYQAITVLQELGTTLRVYATLRSKDFDAAYLARWTALFRLPASARRALEREFAAQRARGYSLFVVAATHDRTWNDFDRPRSQWRLALSNDRGEQVNADRIVAERRILSTERAMLPHLGAFYQLYRVEFPRTLPDGRPLVAAETWALKLSMSGPLGDTELVWRLR
ncbi:MAG: hypothetical protein IPL40_12820 [Proteobacteria bacterium]|nr:hypothetical protein [Pseudomonadota bacterium]